MDTQSKQTSAAAPGAMLSLKRLAEAIGVSESTIRRWADEGQLQVTRTKGGHRRVSRREVIRFIRESDCELICPEVLGIHSLDDDRDLKASPGRSVELLVAALRDGISETARGIIVRTYLAGRSAAWIADELLKEAMAELGKLWMHEREGIFIEHRATDICVQAVNELRSLLDEPAENAPAAIGAAPENDPYVVPTTMASIVLREAGFRSINLGPLTPIDALVQGVEHCKPKLVWLAMSSLGESQRLAEQLEGLVEAVAQQNAQLIVGGRGADQAVFGRLDRTTVVQSMSELAGFAKGFALRPESR